MLRDYGFAHDRTRGSHEVWEKPGGYTITLPVVNLNYMIGNKIARQIQESM